MTNEEKIISMLESLQKEVADLKAEIKESRYKKSMREETQDEYIARQLTALEGMRSVLTKEEADKLAEIVGI
ncbi:MAG: hypothetical protein IKZ58_02650 [Selenomonadaceae bacterium]|nr:hypothetical protein [Selenomonadaceae bacterium]